jgi:acetyltransferase
VGRKGEDEIMGVVRLYRDQDDRDRAEFAITVRSDYKRRGVGATLLRRLIAYARDQGLRELYGDILVENAGMRRLAEHLGFTLRPIPETSEILRATLAL